MASIHDDFENEKDLAAEFERAPSVGTPNEIGTAEAFGTGVARGLIPFEDRVVAAGKTGLEQMNLMQGPGNYDENLARIRKYNKEASEQHPWASGAGQVAGGIGQFAGLGALGVAGKLGLAGEGLLGAAKGGAILGGVQGASESEDLSQPMDVLKNTAKGAAIGAAAAPIAGTLVGGAAKLGGELMDRATQLKVVQKLAQGMRAGESGAVPSLGKSGAGSEALANAASNAEDSAGSVIDKMKAMHKDLIQNEYNALYKTANDVNPAGVSSEDLAKRLTDLKQNIKNDSTQMPRYVESGGMDLIDSELNAMKAKAGIVEAPPNQMGVAPGTPLPGIPKQPMSYSELGAKLQSIKSQMGPDGNPALRDLTGIYDSQLDWELAQLADNAAGTEGAHLGDRKDVLDGKYRALSGLMDRIGVKPNFMDDNANQDAARKLTGLFSNAVSGDPDALNDTARLGTGLLSLENAGKSIPTPLEESVAPHLSDLADKAETLNVIGNRNKESILGGDVLTGNLSKSALWNEAGIAAGSAKRTAQQAIDSIQQTKPFQFAQNIISGMSKAADTEPEAVQSVAQHLQASVNPVTKRMGNLLGKVAQEKDIGKRRALMFSLSQQAAFRSAILSAFSGVKSPEGEAPPEGF